MQPWSHKASEKAKRRDLIETRNSPIANTIENLQSSDIMGRKDAKKLDLMFLHLTGISKEQPKEILVLSK